MNEVLAVAGGVLKTKAGDIPVAAYLGYADSEPHEVSMTIVADFEIEDGRVLSDQQTWIFGRDLIDQAMSTMLPAGTGDVSVEYQAASDTVKVGLTDVHGAKHFLYVEAEPVVEFMAQTFTLAPADAEMDMDGVIDALLAEDAK